jgi:uncharacterized protein YegL
MQRSHSLRPPIFHLLAWMALLGFFQGNAIAQENVVIVLDDSGSMNETMRNGNSRMEAAKKAIAATLQKFDAKTKLGILLLNGAQGKDHWVVPLSPLSAGPTTRLVTSLSANGGTPLGERMREGADALLKSREKQIYGTYRLLVVTDGEANDGRLLNAYLPDILSRGLVVDAIGVDMKTDHSLATLVHSYRKADDDAALEKALEEVFAEKIVSQGAGKDDYQLLEGLEADTAKEALVLLSRPNNTPIESKAKPVHWGNVQSGGDDSILTAILGGILGCIIPLILFFVLLNVVVSKFKKPQNRRRR